MLVNILVALVNVLYVYIFIKRLSFNLSTVYIVFKLEYLVGAKNIIFCYSEQPNIFFIPVYCLNQSGFTA
jgi:hypothetical protein